MGNEELLLKKGRDKCYPEIEMKLQWKPMLIALLLAGPAAAQTPGDVYRERSSGRRIQVVHADSAMIRYVVLDTVSAAKTAFFREFLLADAAGAAPTDGSQAFVRATPTMAAAVPAAETLQRGRYAEPDLAFANFNNGSTAPFTTAKGETRGNDDIRVVDGAVRIRYARLSSRYSVDVNRALRWVHPKGVGLGQTVFFRGHVTVPVPPREMGGAMRKLFYVQRRRNDASFCVIKLQGTSLKAEITGNRVFAAGTVPYGTTASIEVQMTGSSSVAASDGVLRIWLNGELVLDRPDIRWFTSPAPFKVFLFGQQTQHQRNNASVTFDEYRVWDNLAISSRRIGP